MKVKEESWTCKVKQGKRPVSRIMGRLKNGIAFASYLSDGDIDWPSLDLTVTEASPRLSLASLDFLACAFLARMTILRDCSQSNGDISVTADTDNGHFDIIEKF